MTATRRLKRSRSVALTTLTATAGTITLAGCTDDPMVEGQVFGTVAECISAGVAASECQAGYSQALADNANDAPRFESRDLCEGEFGAGQCQPGANGGGSFWVPLLAGFVIANAVNNVDIDIDRRKRRYAPLYRSRSNGNWYYGGSNYGPMTSTGNGRYGFAPDTLNRPVSAPRVQSRADIASRGGFGGRASARSSGG